MPIDATSGPVLPTVPANQSQPPSDLTVQPAEPPRAQESASGQPAITGAGASVEDRAQLGTHDGPRVGVEAGTHGGAAIPSTLLEGAMAWGLSGFLDMEDKIVLGPMSREFGQAIRTQETNPHVRAAFAANARLRENPTQQARDEAEAANARSKTFHRVVNALTSRLLRDKTELRDAIEKANNSHSVPGDMDHLCWSPQWALSQCGQFERAIDICELGIAYGNDTPTLDNYLRVANLLICAGKSSLAAELIRRVTDPERDFPADINGYSRVTVHQLASTQLLLGDYAGALGTVEALQGPDRGLYRRSEIVAVANYKLAMLKPEGAEREALIAASNAAIREFVDNSAPGARARAALVGLYFDMGRVAEAMHCIEEEAMRPPGDKIDYAQMECLLERPSVIHSTQRASIFANPVWAEYARVTECPNPAHVLMDRESVDVSFDLPAIIAPPLHKILSVRDLEAQMTGSQATRARSESEAKR